MPKIVQHLLPLNILTAVFFACLIQPHAVIAQDVEESPHEAVEIDPDVSVRELIESEKKAEQLIEELHDSASRGERIESTPLRTLLAILEASKAKDYSAAADYLDMRYLPDDMAQWTPEDLLKALGYVFSRQNIIKLSDISDEPSGRKNDGLPGYRDQIGEIVLVNETIPIYLQSIPDGKGSRIWKISNASVAEIPRMWEELGYSPLAIFLSELLPETRFMGMDNWQLFATMFIVLIAWPLAALICAIVLRIVLFVYDRFPLATTNFISGPLRFFLFIMIARGLINQLGLSLTARIWLDSSGVDYIAFTVLILGLISFVRDYQMRKMQRAGNAQHVALLKPFTTIVKLVVVLIIALFWADTAGYNMSTVLAGLGVGSLAIALAAQKTLENVIGAATLYTARPVVVGDFCRFGTSVGTVEEIGLRSTVIRTLDRTLMVIPNAVFSSTEVENYSARDRIRYYRRFRLQLNGADQLRYILAKVRETLYGHPQVLQETVSVRFETIEEGTAWLRLDSGVNTTDFQEFLAVAEDINLRIVEIVEEAGAHFSGPARLIRHEELQEKAEAGALIQQTLQEWREQDALPFPNHSEEELAQLKDSLQYPPKGAPA
jgi:MscS family membrane protein